MGRKPFVTSATKDLAFSRGYDAAYAGKDIDFDNPHKLPENPHHKAWRDGFCTAMIAKSSDGCRTFHRGIERTWTASRERNLRLKQKAGWGI